MSEKTPSKYRITPARSAASRINGQKSKGPKTIEGRRISSRNSLKHALACTTKTPMLLPGEDGDRLAELVRSFTALAGPGREQLVDTLVAETWRVNRALRLENERMRAFSAEENEIAGESENVILAHAWDEMSYESITAAVNRHSRSARSRFRKAVQQLLKASKVVPIRPRADMQ